MGFLASLLGEVQGACMTKMVLVRFLRIVARQGRVRFAADKYPDGTWNAKLVTPKWGVMFGEEQRDVKKDVKKLKDEKPETK